MSKHCNIGLIVCVTSISLPNSAFSKSGALIRGFPQQCWRYWSTHFPIKPHKSSLQVASKPYWLPGVSGIIEKCPPLRKDLHPYYICVQIVYLRCSSCYSHFRGNWFTFRHDNSYLYASVPCAAVKNEWSYASVLSVCIRGLFRDNFSL